MFEKKDAMHAAAETELIVVENNPPELIGRGPGISSSKKIDGEKVGMIVGLVFLVWFTAIVMLIVTTLVVRWLYY